MTQAMHAIQDEAMQLVNIRITAAIEACDWVAVARLTEGLRDLAERGMYHTSKERLASINAFALNGHCEGDPR